MRDWRTNNWRCEQGCPEYDGGCDWCRWRLEDLMDERVELLTPGGIPPGFADAIERLSE